MALDVRHLKARCDNGLCGPATGVNRQHGQVALVPIAVRPEVFGRVGWVVVAARRHARRWLPIRPVAGGRNSD